MSEELRKEIKRVLNEWQSAKLTCQGVQHWARDVSTRGADAFAERVVLQLRELGEYLITIDDIKVYLQGLVLPPELGVKHLEHEGAKFDAKSRATDLKDDPFYGPHTKAILKELS